MIADLPGVGENLQNHGGIYYPFTLNSSVPNFEDKVSDDLNINEYIERRTGKVFIKIHIVANTY